MEDLQCLFCSNYYRQDILRTHLPECAEDYLNALTPLAHLQDRQLQFEGLDVLGHIVDRWIGFMENYNRTLTNFPQLDQVERLGMNFIRLAQQLALRLQQEFDAYTDEDTDELLAALAQLNPFAARDRRNRLTRAVALQIAGKLALYRVMQRVRITRTMANQTCAVCQEQFSPISDIVRLNCGHFFHFRCIDQWFQLNPRCPIDRRATDAM